MFCQIFFVFVLVVGLVFGVIGFVGVQSFIFSDVVEEVIEGQFSWYLLVLVDGDILCVDC